jgi:hypothetical protein
MLPSCCPAPGIESPAVTLPRMDVVAAFTITIHVLDIVVAAIVVLLYLLVKVWRRI